MSIRRPARLTGVRPRSWGFEIYVKVDGKQTQTTVPLSATSEEIRLARESLRSRLLASREFDPGTLAQDISRFLETQQGRRRTDFRVCLKPWSVALGKRARLSIKRADVVDCLRAWQQDGYAPSSLNHFRSAFISLWKWCEVRRDQPLPCPASAVAKFKERNIRRGFFEHAEYLAVRSQLPTDHADLVEFLYYSGWRHSEARDLTWDEIDFKGEVVRLSPERSKNEEGRELPIQGPIKEVLTRRLACQQSHLPFVFHYRRGAQLKPQRIANWRKTWKDACRAAGLDGKLIHDFRRTVVRNLTRAGTPERVAMLWTGHKTRAVFDRYNISGLRDLGGR
jgi:integrase